MGKIQNAVAGRKVGNGTTLKDYIKLMEGEIAKALPTVITPERFTRMVLSAISSNSQLAQCSHESFLGAMMSAAQLGVEPNTPLGQAYLIPFRNNRKGIIECQFQLGYKGLIDLAYRSGEVSIIQAQTVKENDVFEYELGLEPKLKHIPARANRGDTVYYYAVFKTKSGGSGFEVMSVEDIEKYAKKYSKAYGSGPWQSDFDQMAKKTVLKQCLKYAPLKSDFARMIVADGTVREDVGNKYEDAVITADYEIKSEIEAELEEKDKIADKELDEEAESVFR